MLLAHPISKHTDSAPHRYLYKYIVLPPQRHFENHVQKDVNVKGPTSHDLGQTLNQVETFKHFSHFKHLEANVLNLCEFIHSFL